MKVLARSVLKVEDLQDKKNKGAKYIEIQTVEEDVLTPYDTYSMYNQMKDLGLIVKSVNVPIKLEYSIEGLLNFKGSRVINNTCRMADEFGKMSGNIVDVTLHHVLKLKQLEAWGLMDELLREVGLMMDRYTNIIINIKNLSAIEDNNGSLILESSYMAYSIELCNRIRREFGTKRIGVVLDICHLMDTNKALKPYWRNIVDTKESLTNHIHKSKDYVNLIHLTNLRNEGFGKNHGIGLDKEEEVDLLNVILSSLEDVNYQGSLTIEVICEDYRELKVFENKINKYKY